VEIIRILFELNHAQAITDGLAFGSHFLGDMDCLYLIEDSLELCRSLAKDQRMEPPAAAGWGQDENITIVESWED
jgi:hypothetical protein